jgi:uncharacterized protein (TIGR03067 family)
MTLAGRMIMNIRYFGIIMAVLLIVAGPLRGDDSKKGKDSGKDKAKIQGTWMLESLEADGQQGPAEIIATLTLSFKDDKLVFSPGEPGFTNYTFKLDPTTTPPSFDMTPVEGTDKGKATKGIYLLQGDTLKICLGHDKRPKDFTTKAASGRAMYVLKRAKR